MYRRYLGQAARLATDTTELRAILGRRCGALNDRASSCGRGQQAFEPHAREDQPEGHGHPHSSITLCGPVARASRTSRVAAPSSAARSPGKPAGAGRKFVLNRHRRTNRTRFSDVPLEFYEIGMGHDTVGNIDGEVVTGIA
jgi:hypothetical protein